MSDKQKLDAFEQLYGYSDDDLNKLSVGNLLQRAYLEGMMDAEQDDICIYEGLLNVCEELQESAAYWSEYDVPIGIVDRLNSAIEFAYGVENIDE